MSTDTQKVAIITGASKGMGRAISFALAREGFTLVACARNKEALQQLQADIIQQSPETSLILKICDFADPAQVQELVNWIETSLQRVDVLVNNVGLFTPGSIFDEAGDALSKHMQVNLFAQHLLAVCVGRMMKANKSGHIFNISSIASREAIAAAASYTVSKFALAGLTAVLREELRSHQVKVTEIVPGSTLTSSWEGTNVPPEKFILPEDIAEALVSALNMSRGANIDEIIIKPVSGQV